MTTALLERANESRLRAWEAAKAIVDTVESEKRDFTAEEDQAYARANTEMDTLDQRIAALIANEERSQSFADVDAKLDRMKGKAPKPTGLEAQLRSFLRGEVRAIDIPKDAPELRALTAGTTTVTAGSPLVPVSFYGSIREHMIVAAAMLQAGATVLETSSGELIRVPTSTGDGTAVLLTEGASLTSSDPTITERALGAFKYGRLLQVSHELVTDEQSNILPFLAKVAGRSLGTAFGADLVIGNGTNKARGITLDSTLGVTGGAAAPPTADNIIDLFYSVNMMYRAAPDAAFLMADVTVAGVRKLKDTTNQYIWQPALTAGSPDTLLGKKIVTDPNVPVVGTGNKSVLFGDMSAYFVRLAGGIRFERSDDFAFGSDLVTFRAIARVDGQLVDRTGAVKHYVSA